MARAPMRKGSARPSRTALRLGAAFAAVLALFGVALFVMLGALRRIGQAEMEVAALDRAKHAGHMAAANVREQYIHQAHTIINWDESHMPRYEAAVAATRASMDHLRMMAATPDEQAHVDEIARLADQNDRDFRDKVLPAIASNDHATVRQLHDATDALVSRVLRLNDELNDMFERRSAAARARAERLRGRVRTVTLLCFGLAIVLAAAVGFLLMRSILRPVSALQTGARRAGAGDLSARIHVDGKDEFAMLAATFNQMMADLEHHQAELVRSHKLASVGQVAAGVAHEINNPLGVILGYLKLLRRDESLAGHEELKIIEDEALQCQRIVRGLLDLARPPRLELGPVDLAELARDAAERLEEAGKLSGARVTLPPREARALAHADETKIRQVIWNILVNAAEAGGSVALTAGHEDGEAVLRVSDTGPGMAPDVLAHVFDPFFTTKNTGIGLGLPIAQAIVDAHGGRIEIDSRPSEGTRVWLRLPAAKEQP